jgi:hypothetical protein
MFIRETIKAIDGLSMSDADRHKLYCGNALCMLGLEADRARAGVVDNSAR